MGQPQPHAFPSSDLCLSTKFNSCCNEAPDTIADPAFLAMHQGLDIDHLFSNKSPSYRINSQPLIGQFINRNTYRSSAQRLEVPS